MESEGGLVIENGLFSMTRGAIGDRVYLACKTGYELRGDPEWLCSDNGTWTGSTKCVAATCDPLEDSLATASVKDYR